MPPNDELTQRIRSVVALDPRVTEKRMFGGICFLLDGKILASARRTGTMMLQLGADAAAEAVKQPGVAYMVMKGKNTPNFVDVDLGVLETDDDLRHWIGIAERYVASKR